MRINRWVGLGLSLLAFSCPASAQEVYVTKEQQKGLYEAAQRSPTPEVTGVINLYQSVLSYKQPKAYVPAHRSTSPDGFLIEFVPFGQEVKENWSEMLTITAMPARVAGNFPTSSIAIIMINGMMTRCPDSYVGEDLGPVSVEGAEAHRILFGCKNGAGGKSGAAELAVVQIIRRKGDVITVQYARRGKNTKDAPLMDQKKQQHYTSLLDGLVLQDSLLTPAK